MQEEIKIRGNKSHFQKNLYLCWNKECLTEQGGIGGRGKLRRIKIKLRFQFCKQLCMWLIDVCYDGWGGMGGVGWGRMGWGAWDGVHGMGQNGMAGLSSSCIMLPHQGQVAFAVSSPYTMKAEGRQGEAGKGA